MLLAGWQIAGIVLGSMMVGGAFGVGVMALLSAGKGWRPYEEDDEDD